MSNDHPFLTDPTTGKPWVEPQASKDAAKFTPAGKCTPAALGSGPEGETCGTCRHAIRMTRTGARRWIKCGMMRRSWTHSTRTDVLARWHACSSWAGGYPIGRRVTQAETVARARQQLALQQIRYGARFGYQLGLSVLYDHDGGLWRLSAGVDWVDVELACRDQPPPAPRRTVADLFKSLTEED